MPTASQLESAADDYSGQTEAVKEQLVVWHHHGGIGNGRISVHTQIQLSDVKARTSELRVAGIAYDSGLTEPNPLSTKENACWILGDDRVRVIRARLKHINQMSYETRQIWNAVSPEQRAQVRLLANVPPHWDD